MAEDQITDGTVDVVSSFEQEQEQLDEAGIERAKQEAQREREAQEREARYAKDREDETAFSVQLAGLINANLGKLTFGGIRVQSAWARSNQVYMMLDGERIVTAYSAAGQYYAWEVQEAVLEYARTLGHKPSDWSYTYTDVGRVSACQRCDAMARIAEDNEVIAAQYMARCKGKR